MDGFELLDELRKVPAWGSISVVVLTAKELTPHERTRLESQVEKVHTKRRVEPGRGARRADAARPGGRGGAA